MWLRIMASSIIMEAVACVMKYFVAASVDRGDFLCVSRGIMASRLISSPTHISRRFELIIVTIGPIRIVRETVSNVRGFISMGGV